MVNDVLKINLMGWKLTVMLSIREMDRLAIKNIIPIKGKSIEQRMEVNYLSCKQGVVSHKLEKKCQEEETYLKIITK